jgi:hypothetical protein
MNKIIFSSFLLLVAFIHNKLPAKEPIYCSYADRLVSQHIKEMNKRYGFTCFGTGGSFMEDVKLIEIYYKADIDSTLSKARKLVLESSDYLLKLVNEDDIIQPYLHEHPFTYHDINITLNFNKKHQEDYEKAHYISTATLSKNKIYYYFTIDKWSSELVLVETVEEALNHIESDNL